LQRDRLSNGPRRPILPSLTTSSPPLPLHPFGDPPLLRRPMVRRVVSPHTRAGLHQPGDPVGFDERRSKEAIDRGVEQGRVVIGDHVRGAGEDGQLGVRQVVIDLQRVVVSDGVVVAGQNQDGRGDRPQGMGTGGMFPEQRILLLGLKVEIGVWFLSLDPLGSPVTEGSRKPDRALFD